MAQKRKYVRYVYPEDIERINPQNLELWQRFINGKRNLAPTTKRGYENDMMQFFVYILKNWDNRYLLDLDDSEACDLLDDYVSFCVGSVLQNSERRVARRISAISSLYQYYIKRRKIKTNPVDLIERVRAQNGKWIQERTFLTQEEVQKIREYLAARDDVQLSAFWEVASYTMMRVGALQSIKVAQINLEEKTIFKVTEKLGKEVDFSLDDKCVELIKKWLKVRNEMKIESELLFVNRKGKSAKPLMQGAWIKEIGKVVGKNLHCHDIRHSFADLRFRAGMTLEALSAALNHNGTEVTLNCYLQKNQEKLREDMEKFKV